MGAAGRVKFRKAQVGDGGVLGRTVTKSNAALTVL